MDVGQPAPAMAARPAPPSTLKRCRRRRPSLLDRRWRGHPCGSAVSFSTDPLPSSHPSAFRTGLRATGAPHSCALLHDLDAAGVSRPSRAKKGPCGEPWAMGSHRRGRSAGFRQPGRGPLTLARSGRRRSRRLPGRPEGLERGGRGPLRAPTGRASSKIAPCAST